MCLVSPSLFVLGNEAEKGVCCILLVLAAGNKTIAVV